jgi:uncharacterized membrane protein
MNLWELHPALVHFPIAFLLASTALDVVAVHRRQVDLAKAALGLLVAGELSAIVAAGAGALAYFTVPTHSEQAHVRMLIHPLLAVGSVVVYALHARSRLKHKGEIASRSSMGLSLFAAALMVTAGALGGYLVYHDAVGVSVEHIGVPGGHEHGHTH